MGKMSKVKSGAKGVLNQRVRVGLFTVPLWVVGAVFLVRCGTAAASSTPEPGLLPPHAPGWSA
jgi:hypothetical protein